MKRVYACLLVVAMILSGCAAAETDTASVETVKVVSTIFPQYDFARAIGGDMIKQTMLIKPGVETHSFEPTPQDIIAISECDLFIYAGGVSDSWIESMLSSMDTSDKIIINMLELVDALEEETVEGMEAEHEHEEGEEHEHAGEIEYDEHVWTSPKNAILICEAIRDALKTLDPANAEAYEANAEAYIGQLDALDAQFREIVDSSARKTMLFADRFPFLYFAKEYGLSYYAAFPGCSGDTEPSAATVAFLISKINDEELPAVLYLELSTHKIADIISEETGCKALLFHSCHNLTADDFKNGATYVSLMTGNLESLKEALS